jgi:hypothetical protein
MTAWGHVRRVATITRLPGTDHPRTLCRLRRCNRTGLLLPFPLHRNGHLARDLCLDCRVGKVDPGCRVALESRNLRIRVGLQQLNPGRS